MHNRQSIIRLGGALAFVAGAVNAGGFLAIGRYTSHMTGMASSIADYVILHDTKAALLAGAFLMTFVFGAAAASLIVNCARSKQFQNEYAPILALESVLLLLFSQGADKPLGGAEWIPIALLCFTMGLQNAMITKISNATIRTTHITGMITDLGIELGRCLFNLLAHRPAPRTAKDIGLYLSLVLLFIGGGVAGAFLFQRIGFLFTLPLAVILMALAASIRR